MLVHRSKARTSAQPGNAARTPAKCRSWLSRAVACAVSVATIVVAVLALRRCAGQWDWPQVLSGMRHESGLSLMAATTLTFASFASLSAYDALGCAMVVPGRVRLGTALFAGATANAISNTLGFHALTGTAVRLRIYRREGLLAGDTMRVISLSWMGIGLGLIAIISLAGVVAGPAGGGGGALSWSTSIGLSAALAVFLPWLSGAGRTLRLGGIRLELPSMRVALGLLALGTVENGAAIGALYVLLPGACAPPFLPFAFSYIGAVTLGVVSQVPGGLGVFEAALMAIWSGRMGTALAPALLVYRLVYNLLPFALSMAALALWELGHLAGRARRVSSKLGSDGSTTAA